MVQKPYWIIHIIRTSDQRRTQGGFGVNPPTIFDMLQKLNYLRKGDSLFLENLLLVNLSTCCKYLGMNLHANLKEHCKWAKKY